MNHEEIDLTIVYCAKYRTGFAIVPKFVQLVKEFTLRPLKI